MSQYPGFVFYFFFVGWLVLWVLLLCLFGFFFVVLFVCLVGFYFSGD